MARSPKNQRLGPGNPSPRKMTAREVRAKKRFEALFTNYVLQGTPEDEARVQALKDIEDDPRN